MVVPLLTNLRSEISTLSIDRAEISDSNLSKSGETKGGGRILNARQFQVLKDAYCVHIGSILCKYVPAFAWMKPCIPDHIPHDLQDVMAEKSEIHPMQVCMKYSITHLACFY